MSTQEERQWLRAILKGEIKPGDTDWERVKTDEEFKNIRKVLRRANRVELAGRQESLERMWQHLEKLRDVEAHRLHTSPYRWVAVAALVLAVGGGVLWGWLGMGTGHSKRLAQGDADVSTQVTLFMAQGEKVVLSDIVQDTVLQQGNTDIHLDGDGGVAYRAATDSVGDISNPMTFNRLVVPSKCECQILLDDGTKVYLNAGSQLRYPTLFGGGERRVYLEGEAYFEVACDTLRPFFVETGTQNIRVLGTTFNVYAYPGEILNYTTLESGSVRVEDMVTGNTHQLKPGQQLTFNAETGVSTTQEVDVQQVLAWKNNMFVFDGQSLEQIMMKLERWYDITVFFHSQAAKNFVFKGNMRRYESLQSVLDILEKTSNVKFNLKGNVVTISM